MSEQSQDRYLHTIIPSVLERNVGSESDGYRLDERLGEAPYTDDHLIYRGVGTATGTSIVAKLYGPRDHRFLRERDIRKKLPRHRHVLSTHELVETEGCRAIVTPFEDAHTLLTIIKDSPLSVDQAITLARILEPTLGWMHGYGVLHRDLKPGNVLVPLQGGLGRAKLFDFDIGHVRPHRDQEGEILGSLMYMCPEVLRGNMQAEGIDSYGLGITEFEAITGRMPYDGHAINSIMHAILRDPVPDPREFRPNIPPAVAEVVKQGIAKDPQDRIPKGQYHARLLAASRARLRPRRKIWGGISIPLPQKLAGFANAYS